MILTFENSCTLPLNAHGFAKLLRTLADELLAGTAETVNYHIREEGQEFTLTMTVLDRSVPSASVEISRP